MNTSSRKDYRVAISSNLGTNNYGQGVDKYDYYFNWSVMEDRPYEVSFSFLSTAFTPSFDDLATCILQSDLFTENNYIAGTTEVANNTNYLGLLTGVQAVGSKTSFFADTSTNTPFLIPGRPRQNKFYINFGQLGVTTGGNGEFTVKGLKYTIMFHFKGL